MISSHAAQASGTAATWNGSTATGVAGVTSTADTSLFQSLFAGLAAAATGTVTQSSTAATSNAVPDAKTQRGDVHKSSDATETNASTADQPIIIPAQNPLPWILNSLTIPSSTVGAADQAPGSQAASSNITTATQNEAALSAAVTPAAPAMAKILALLTPVSSYKLTNAQLPESSDKAAAPANSTTGLANEGTGMPAVSLGESALNPAQNSVPASAKLVPSYALATPAQPMQTAFSVFVHPAAEKEQPLFNGAAIPAPDQGVMGDQTATAEPPTVAAVPAPPEVAPSTAIPAQVNTNTTQTSVAPTASSMTGTAGVSNSSASQSAQVVNATNPTTISAVTSSNKAESAANGNSKSSPDQSDDKQSPIPLIDTNNAAPMASKFESVSPAAGSNMRAVTEYVAPQHTTAAATPSNGAVTDIRVQVDGAANQHVNVRVVQEPEGLRVTVRSNDENLTQTLQDRLPELTSRLEQHHFQADVSVPERAAATPSGETGPGTNSQQDTSGRNQNSGGQGNPQNRQNQQQEQTAEDDVFANLLGIRR